MAKTYKVYESEDKISAKGNAYKKLVLQAPDEKFPLKNVTMFASHPLFEEIAPGQTVELEIETKDSDTPNPHGGFYKNRTVLNPGQTAQTQTKASQANKDPNTGFNVGNAELKNLIKLEIAPILNKIYREVIAISARQERQMGLVPGAIDEAIDNAADSSPF